jgi:hypothetical protein
MEERIYEADMKKSQSNRNDYISCPADLCASLLLHCKKRFAIFPSPAGMSLTKLSLGGNIPAQGEFSQ